MPGRFLRCSVRGSGVLVPFLRRRHLEEVAGTAEHRCLHVPVGHRAAAALDGLQAAFLRGLASGGRVHLFPPELVGTTIIHEKLREVKVYQETLFLPFYK